MVAPGSPSVVVRLLSSALYLHKLGRNRPTSQALAAALHLPGVRWHFSLHSLTTSQVLWWTPWSSWVNLPSVLHNSEGLWRTPDRRKKWQKLGWTWPISPHLQWIVRGSCGNSVRGEMSSGGIRGKTVMWHKGTTAEHMRKIERSEVSAETRKGGITLITSV